MGQAKMCQQLFSKAKFVRMFFAQREQNVH